MHHGHMLDGEIKPKIFTPESFEALRKNELDYLQKKENLNTEKQSKVKKLISEAIYGNEATPDENQFPASTDPCLQNGEQLPDKLLDKKWLNQPLEDLDPYYATRGSKTFCVASKKFGTDYIYRFSATKSLFLFSPFNPIRYWALRTILHPLFDASIILVILINCVFLALDNEIEEAEYVFTAIYTIEMIIKLVARGFFLNQFTYLRDPWNWLDFVVVVLAYATFAGSANVSSLRTFRVFRAFRSISIIPGLKVIVNSVFHSLKPLGEVLLIMVFLLIIVALIALQAYQGVLRRRCVSVPEPSIITSDLSWLVYVTNPDHWNPVDGELIACGNSTGSGFCPTNFVCLNDVGNNPNFGYTGFDNMGLSLLTSFQLITLDFWENVYNLIIRAEGPWSMLFFLMSVFLGPFYLLNLLLAVITLAYTREEERQKEIKENREKSQMEQKRRRKRRRSVENRQKAVPPPPNQQDTAITITSDESEQTSQNLPGESLQAETAAEKRLRFKAKPQNMSLESNDTVDSSKTENKWLVRVKKFRVWFEETFCCWKCSHCFEDFQSLLERFVLLKVFEVFIMLCIFVNTIFLAIDHYGISTELENALNTGNIVFTIIFTVEASLKITAFGPVKYIKDLWNLFDFLIVLVSLVELGIELSGNASGVNGLTVLRTMRLLRVFRLARTWGTMRKLVEIIWSTVGPVGYLTVIMFLILYIFAVITKQIFGAQYAANAFLFDDNQVPRWNCVDFYHSFLLVWRIMCGEWIEPLYECLHITGGDGFCIFLFILIFLITNFLVLNLFTAILLGAFQVDQFSKSKNKKETEKRQAVLKLQVIEAFKSFGKRKRTSNSIQPEAATGNVLNQSDQNLNPKNRIFSLDFKKSQEVIQLAQRFQTRRKTTTILPSDDDASRSRAKKNWQKALHSQRFILRSIEKAYERKNQQVKTSSSNVGSAAVELNHKIENGFPRRSIDSQLQTTVEYHADYRLCSVLYCCCYLEREYEDDVVHLQELHQGNDDESTYTSTTLQDINESESIVSVSTTSIEQTEDPDKDIEVPYCFPKPLRNRFPSLKKKIDSPVYNYWMRLRKACKNLANNNYFEWFILFLILGSTVSLALEDAYLDSHPLRKLVLQKLEYIFTALFTIEMILKWVGFGATNYFTSIWCLLDCVIVAVSWTGIILDATNQGAQTGAFRSLRTLRALRPLRAVSRWEGMKVVVNSLIYCIPSIGNVICVCFLIWFVFGIMGVQFFKGGFFRCVDQNGEVVNNASIVNRADCDLAGFSWINPNINFDNVAIAMVALFQVATFEGWLEVIADASDIRGIDLQPVRNFSQYNTIFFVIFVLVGSFFILNLIIGVIIESFQQLSKKENKTSALENIMTESQKQFYKTVKTMLNNKPKQRLPEPKNRVQRAIFKLVTHTRFELAIFIIICLNMITLCMEHYRMPQTWTDVLRIIDIVFTSLFGVEAILKIIGLRKYYFRDSFNNFDLLVVVVSIAGFILESLITLTVSPTLLRIVRVFRVFRVLRVVRAAKGIRRLIITLLVSVPALFNIAVLLSVFLVIFSILGMNLFMHVQLMGGLNNLVNFRTFANAIMLLFRLVTSAGWNEILDPLMNTRNCTPASGSDPGNCGDPIAAVIYMVIFIFLMFLVIVNMYIAIILENFEDILRQDESGISSGDFEQFYAVWARYDPNANQFVTLTTLSNLLHDLRPPFRIEKPNQVKIVALELPVLAGDRVHCLDVLFALVKRILGDIDIPDDIKKEAENLLAKSFPGRKNVKAVSTTLIKAQQDRAAKKIQDAWKSYLQRRDTPGLTQLIQDALRNKRNETSETSEEKPPTSSETVTPSPQRPKREVKSNVNAALIEFVRSVETPGESGVSRIPSDSNLPDSVVNPEPKKQIQTRPKTVGSKPSGDRGRPQRPRTTSQSNEFSSEFGGGDLIESPPLNKPKPNQPQAVPLKPKIQNFVSEKPTTDDSKDKVQAAIKSASASPTQRDRVNSNQVS